MRIALASVILAAALFAAGARAQVAVVTAHDANDAQQNWLAGAVAAGAMAHWQALSPQLLPQDYRRCAATDFACFCEIAKARGASHVLVIGVAPLGAREAVVSAQLLAASDARMLFEEAVVQPGERGGDDAGRAVVLEMVARLVSQEGPPAVAPRPAPPPTDDAASPLISPLGMTGLGALGVGALAGGVGATVATLQVTLAADYQGASTSAIVATTVAGVALLAGAVILAVDGL